ncbi:MAG: iron ABC transporter permease [Sedimentisphaerales bacterium]|nr:iron ABC transporter permease [Sedimentisphaerales bacterium]
MLLTKRKLIAQLVIALALLAVVMCLCSLVGSYKISLQRLFEGPAQTGRNLDYEIFIGVRLPRVVLAAMVGAALACSGVVLQAVLRNPLADPYILGISSGAGLGVVTAVLLGATWSFLGSSALAVFAFAGAIMTVWLVWLIGCFAGKSQITALLLAGVVINAFFSAIIMFLTSITNSQQLRSTTLWLMGNITEAPPAALWAGSAAIVLGIIGLFTISFRLNVLTFGQAEARSLGVDPAGTRLIAFGLSAFITAVAVSLSGLIGFVGLIVPHAVRLMLGPEHRRLLPLSAITGAGFLVIADTAARTIITPAQLPAGVITAMAGGPFFLILLARHTRKVGWFR